MTIWEEKISSEPAVVPDVAEDNQAAGDSRTESAVKFNPKLAGALHGEWVIIAAGKTKIERDEDMPYINFDTTDGRVYAITDSITLTAHSLHRRNPLSSSCR